MKFAFGKKRKNFSMVVENCGFWKRFSGLMFTSLKNARPLLFDFKKKTNIYLHSFFVFFEFLAVWLNEKNEVVDLRVVKPFRFSVSTEKKFSKILEIPIKKEYRKIVKDLLG